MTSFELDERFGLVVIPFRSFLCLLTVAEQKACLQRVHEHLVDGGRLALNFFNPNMLMMAEWLNDQRATKRLVERTKRPSAGSRSTIRRRGRRSTTS